MPSGLILHQRKGLQNKHAGCLRTVFKKWAVGRGFGNVMWLECPLQNKIRFKVVMVMVMHVGPERVRPCRLYTHPLEGTKDLSRERFFKACCTLLTLSGFYL